MTGVSDKALDCFEKVKAARPDNDETMLRVGALYAWSHDVKRQDDARLLLCCCLFYIDVTVVITVF